MVNPNLRNLPLAKFLSCLVVVVTVVKMNLSVQLWKVGFCFYWKVCSVRRGGSFLCWVLDIWRYRLFSSGLFVTLN